MDKVGSEPINSNWITCLKIRRASTQNLCLVAFSGLKLNHSVHRFKKLQANLLIHWEKTEIQTQIWQNIQIWTEYDSINNLISGFFYIQKCSVSVFLHLAYYRSIFFNAHQIKTNQQRTDHKHALLAKFTVNHIPKLSGRLKKCHLLNILSITTS